MTRKLLPLFTILFLCGPALAKINEGDTVTRSGWTATVTIAGKRTASYLWQAKFVHVGVPTIVETRDVEKTVTDAQVIAAITAMIDELEATRLQYVWSAATLPGLSKTVSGWTASVGGVRVDIPRRAIVLSLTVSKGDVKRTFDYDLVTRVQAVASVNAEVTAYLTGVIAKIEAAKIPPDDQKALEGATQ